MNMKLFLIAACCLVLVEQSIGQATGIKASKTIENCECNGVEIKDGSTQREFRVSCKKTETVKVKGKDTKKIVWHTSCTYGGDPHSCAKYNKQQTKFYEGLVHVIAKDYCAAALADNECEKTKTYYSDTICTDIPYTFNKAI